MVVIVGGLGNLFGVIVGGFVIVFFEVIIIYVWKKVFRYFLFENLEFDGLV